MQENTPFDETHCPPRPLSLQSASLLQGTHTLSTQAGVAESASQVMALAAAPARSTHTSQTLMAPEVLQ